MVPGSVSPGRVRRASAGRSNGGGLLGSPGGAVTGVYGRRGHRLRWGTVATRRCHGYTARTAVVGDLSAAVPWPIWRTASAGVVSRKLRAGDASTECWTSSAGEALGEAGGLTRRAWRLDLHLLRVLCTPGRAVALGPVVEHLLGHLHVVRFAVPCLQRSSARLHRGIWT